MNGIWVIGRVVAGPEVMSVGDPPVEMVKFSIASKGVNKNDVCFFDCKWFMPSKVLDHLKKGKPFMICGVIKQEKWQDKDGKNRSKLVLLVRTVAFLPSERVAGGNDDAQDIAPKERTNKAVSRPDMDSDLEVNF